MTQRRRIILVSAAVLVVSALTIWLIVPSGAPDPIYHGHRLSEWVSGHPTAAYLTTFPHGIDSNAIPYLVQTLKSHDGVLHRVYLHFYPRLPVWLRNRLPLPVTEYERKFYACLLLGWMGRTARPAIPELLHMLNPDDPRKSQVDAIYALSIIATRDDTNVIEALRVASKDPDRNIRIAAVVALQRLDPTIDGALTP